MPERVTVGALDWGSGRGADVGEQQWCCDPSCHLSEVGVVPGGVDALENGGFAVALAVPADPEAVAVRRGGTHSRVQALVDDRVNGFEQQILGEDRVT